MEELLKPCIICDKKLKSVFDDWKNMQPISGGEVTFVFSYGSRFDNGSYESFRGVICDDCAENSIERMEKTSS